MIGRISVCATIALLVASAIFFSGQPASTVVGSIEAASTTSSKQTPSSDVRRPHVRDELPKDYQPPSLGRRSEESSSVAFSPMVGGSPKPPILDVPIRNAEDRELSVRLDDLVLGLEINGQARAYPVTQLCGPNREIINDHVGGLAIAATW